MPAVIRQRLWHRGLTGGVGLKEQAKRSGRNLVASVWVCYRAADNNSGRLSCVIGVDRMCHENAGTEQDEKRDHQLNHGTNP
jgi:hypothetical protein